MKTKNQPTATKSDEKLATQETPSKDTAACLERLGIKKGPGGHPRIITQCIERIEPYISDKADLFPITVAYKDKDGQIIYKAPREDFRRNIAYTLQAMIAYMDIDTQLVWNPHSQSGYTVEAIAKLAGISKRSAERALQILHKAGFVTSKQIAKQTANNTYTAEPSIKKIESDVFDMLGLGSFLHEEQQKRKNDTLSTKRLWTRTYAAKFNNVLKTCKISLKSNRNNKLSNKSSLKSKFESNYHGSGPKPISYSTNDPAFDFKEAYNSLSADQSRKYNQLLMEAAIRLNLTPKDFTPEVKLKLIHKAKGLT